VSHGSHSVLHETGAAGANAGVQFTPIGQRGVFTADDVRAACKPRGQVVLPPTTLVQIENTHNREGGIVFPQADAESVCAAARDLGLTAYLDGARLWNAAVASGSAPASLAAPFDLVAVAFSKGLGAPGGSLLAGPTELIARAVRYRRMLGGAMRQVGSFAAAALYALDNHYDRLADDHDNARLVADELAQSPRVVLDPGAVATNIVVFGLTPDAPSADDVVARAAEEGVLVFAFGPRTVRAVTHLDVETASCRAGAAALRRVIDA
jgi:threonine aldolase